MGEGHWAVISRVSGGGTLGCHQQGQWGRDTGLSSAGSVGEGHRAVISRVSDRDTGLSSAGSVGEGHWAVISRVSEGGTLSCHQQGQWGRDTGLSSAGSVTETLGCHQQAYQRGQTLTAAVTGRDTH